MPIRAAAILCVTIGLLLIGYFVASSASQPNTIKAGNRMLVVNISGNNEGRRESPVFSLSQGDEVSIKVHSAQSGQLMIHGYTEEGIPVSKGSSVSFNFEAIHSGRYALHLHGDGGSHQEVAVFEIRPPN